VLYPLNELAPDLMIPLLGYVKNLVLNCKDRGLERIEAE
jgi:hypothetical protein